MINTTNSDKYITENVTEDDTYVDTAMLDVQLHIIIKDKDTTEILVNKRG